MTNCSCLWYHFFASFISFIIFSKPQRHSAAPDVSSRCCVVMGTCVCVLPFVYIGRHAGILYMYCGLFCWEACSVVGCRSWRAVCHCNQGWADTTFLQNEYSTSNCFSVVNNTNTEYFDFFVVLHRSHSSARLSRTWWLSQVSLQHKHQCDTRHQYRYRNQYPILVSISTHP